MHKSYNSLTITFLGALCILVFTDCSISLSGISIDPNVKTFNVELLENKANFVEPTLALDLTEDLKDYIRNNTRLNWNSKNPDIVFSGDITSYRISSEAPQEGATTGFNQLRIDVKIEFEDTKNDNNSWEKSFSRFENFSADADFSTVSEDLNETISGYLVQDVFNETFAKNW